MNLTIVIPTYKDRSLYLERTLSFYNDQNFDGKILVGDSSEKPVLSVNKKLVKSFSNLDIRHIYYPKKKYTNIGKLFCNISKYAETDYMCFGGDDDFHIPEILKTCVDFLDNNPDYIGAHGCKVKYAMRFFADVNAIKIEDLSIVRGQYMDIDDPVFRFGCYMGSETSPQYHVTRKSIWEEMYKSSFSLPDSYFLVSEVLPCSIYYISGRVKRFDNLIQYLMEQSPVSYQSENIDYIIKGINSKEWGECVIGIRNDIIELLIKKGIAKEVASSAFDTYFNFRILKIFNDQFIAKYAEPFEKFTSSYRDHHNKYDSVEVLEASSAVGSINKVSTYLTKFINATNSK